MADVRSMLRAERAARAPPKSRKAVPSQTQAPLPAISSTKKRKLESDDSDSQDSKKSKVRFADEDSFATTPLPDEDGAPKVVPEAVPEPVLAPPPIQPANADIVDEEEWAAFEREIATLEPAPDALSAIRASATIEAAPLTAEEIAAQAREELSTQRGRKEAELEAEKEDATRHLEEEFEEMEELEARVKRLRERREQLRRGSETSQRPQAASTNDPHAEKATTDHVETSVLEQINGEEDDEDDDEEDDWDDWRFRAS